MKFIIYLTASFAALLGSVTGSDAPCQNQGGSCQEDYNSCSGSYHSGLCSGAASRRCCLPASGRSDECTSHVLSGGSHDGAHGIGCVGSGCCQYGLQIASLCQGDDVCCFTADTCDTSQTGVGGCPNIVSRADWGARAPKHSIGDMTGPAQYVFIHHGSSAPCTSRSSCISTLKGYQNYHMDGHGWTDIGYNFVVGEDGNAYMARGWTEIGAHTLGYNSVGVAICVIGDFNERLPNDAALDKVKQLIQCGLDLGHISPSYTLKGHRDVGDTDCPGDKLYQLIHTWPHFASGTQRYGLGK